MFSQKFTHKFIGVYSQISVHRVRFTHNKGPGFELIPFLQYIKAFSVHSTTVSIKVFHLNNMVLILLCGSKITGM